MSGTRKQITLDTVYKRRQHLPANSLLPTFTISGSGATVNVYHFIKATEGEADPTGKSTMVLDDASPFPVGVHLVEGDCDNIFFEAAAGSPVVKTKNVVE